MSFPIRIASRCAMTDRGRGRVPPLRHGLILPLFAFLSAWCTPHPPRLTDRPRSSSEGCTAKEQHQQSPPPDRLDQWVHLGDELEHACALLCERKILTGYEKLVNKQ